MIESLEPQPITLEVWIFDANRIREIDPSDWTIRYAIYIAVKLWNGFYPSQLVDSGTLSLANVDPWFAKATLNVGGERKYIVFIAVYYREAHQGTWAVYNFAPES